MARARFSATIIFLSLIAAPSPSLADTLHLPALDSPLIPWTEVVTPVVRQLLPGTSVVSVQDKLDTLLLIEGRSALPVLNQTPRTPEVLELAIITDVRPSAFALPAVEAPLSTSPARVCVSTGLLEMLENESELAFVLAHEFAHLKHDHFSPDIPFAMFTPQQLAQIASVHQNWEYRADADALGMLEARGFEPTVSANILRRLERFEDSSETFHRRHPAVSERIAKVTQALTASSR